MLRSCARTVVRERFISDVELEEGVSAFRKSFYTVCKAFSTPE